MDGTRLMEQLPQGKMAFESATRKQIKVKIALAGPTGAGKTLSALKAARGLVGETGRIALIDADHKRSGFYADFEDFDVLHLEPPFTPERFAEALLLAEQSGYDAVIVDSITQEWSGIGGLIEQADDIERRTGKPGLHCWGKPKAAHKRMMERIKYLNAHQIFTVRAQEKSEQAKDAKGRTVIVSAGFQPDCEKNFMFEVDASAMLDPETNIAKPIKRFPLDGIEWPTKPIDEAFGAAVAAWAAQGEQPDLNAEDVIGRAREAAMGGAVALTDWWSSANEAERDVIRADSNIAADLRAKADAKDAADKGAQTDGDMW